MLYSINLPNFILLFFLLLQILGNMSIVNISFPVEDVINFETNLSFLIKPFTYMTKNVTKELLVWNKKHHLSILKGFQLPKIDSGLGEGL